MNGKTIELAIRNGEREGEWIGAAIINGMRKPEHILLSDTEGRLISKSGNPNRFLKIEDPLWWLRLMPGVGNEQEIIISATLEEKK